MRHGSITSDLQICSECMLLFPLSTRCIETIDVCTWRMFVFMSNAVTVWWSVGIFVV